MTSIDKYRGYIGCRSLNGSRVAQHIQNVVIRDYASNNGFHFLLSGVEYAMPESFLVLNDIIKEIPRIKGIIFYSLFMMPAEINSRICIYNNVIDKGGQLHFALENMSVVSKKDIARVEDVLLINKHITIISR